MKLTLVANQIDRDGHFFPGFTVTIEDDSVEMVEKGLEVVLRLYSPPTFVSSALPD